ncbi:MAG: acetoin utilization protein AcuC [Bacteroidetes bacterium]|nr:MAG: acetoin utilization protein AcuC [Bacteroidota bacterium]
MSSLPVIYSADYLKYDFGPGHPFTPARWEALHDLISGLDLKINWVDATPCTDYHLLRVHDNEFVEAVANASSNLTVPYAGFMGLATGDVPTFKGMHDASKVVCGGSLLAADMVASGHQKRVLQLGGGLHHAMSDRASGFCVYNDLAVMISGLRAKGFRVAYIDIDVHHGDGVQAIFYGDPEVLTVSLHESGEHLFPGTGFVDEIGKGDAKGMSVNVPLVPETTDESYLECFEAVVPDVLVRFEPDVLVVQAGADAHNMDPLAHLCLSTHAYEKLFDRLIALAESITGGRIVCTLGGGYAFDSTLRIWSMLAYKLAGEDLPENLPQAWLERWRQHIRNSGWHSWHDPLSVPESSETNLHIRDANRSTTDRLKLHLIKAN